MFVSGMRSAKQKGKIADILGYNKKYRTKKNGQKQPQGNQRKFDDKQSRALQKRQHLTPYHYTNRKRNVMQIGNKKKDYFGFRAKDV
jgi:uncharacterized protein YeeX (DUF496 family)